MKVLSSVSPAREHREEEQPSIDSSLVKLNTPFPRKVILWNSAFNQLLPICLKNIHFMLFPHRCLHIWNDILNQVWDRISESDLAEVCENNLTIVSQKQVFRMEVSVSKSEWSWLHLFDGFFKGCVFQSFGNDVHNFFRHTLFISLRPCSFNSLETLLPGFSILSI